MLYYIVEGNDALIDIDFSWNHLRQRGARQIIEALQVSFAIILIIIVTSEGLSCLRCSDCRGVFAGLSDSLVF